MFLVSVLFLSFLSSKEFILQNALLTLQSASHHQVQRVPRWSGRQNSDLTLWSFSCVERLSISKWLEVDEEQSRDTAYWLFDAQLWFSVPSTSAVCYVRQVHDQCWSFTQHQQTPMTWRPHCRLTLWSNIQPVDPVVWMFYIHILARTCATFQIRINKKNTHRQYLSLELKGNVPKNPFEIRANICWWQAEAHSCCRPCSFSAFSPLLWPLNPSCASVWISVS